MRAAIRYNESLLVNGTIANDTMYDCPDEGFACPGTTEGGEVYVTCGCPYTAWVECAFSKAEKLKQKVDFLTCWDDTTTSDELQNASTLQGFAEDCAGKAGIGFKDVQACHDGSEKSDLLWKAANDFMDTWPENKPMGGPFHVPHVLIGSGENRSKWEDMNIDLNSTDIIVINKKLCDLGVALPNCSANVSVGFLA